MGGWRTADGRTPFFINSHTRMCMYFTERVSARPPGLPFSFYISIRIDFLGIAFAYCLMLINWVLHRKKAASHSSETARLNGKKKNELFCLCRSALKLRSLKRKTSKISLSPNISFKFHCKGTVFLIPANILTFIFIKSSFSVHFKHHMFIFDENLLFFYFFLHICKKSCTFAARIQNFELTKHKIV